MLPLKGCEGAKAEAVCRRVHPSGGEQVVGGKVEVLATGETSKMESVGMLEQAGFAQEGTGLRESEALKDDEQERGWWWSEESERRRKRERGEESVQGGQK